MRDSCWRQSLRRIDRDLRDAFLIQAEDHAPLQDGSRVVEVDDRRFAPFRHSIGALDQLAAALRQDLDRDVGGNQILFDQLADEVEVRLPKPTGTRTSISLKPIATRAWNICSLRAGSIGSMRA